MDFESALFAAHEPEKLLDEDMTEEEARELEKVEAIGRNFLAWDLNDETAMDKPLRYFFVEMLSMISLSEIHEGDGDTVGNDPVELLFPNKTRTLIPWSRDNGEFSLLDHVVVFPIGLPGFFVPRFKFQIDVPDEVRGGHPKFYRGYVINCIL